MRDKIDNISGFKDQRVVDIVLKYLNDNNILSFNDFNNVVESNFYTIQEIWTDLVDNIDDASVHFHLTNNLDVKEGIIPNNQLDVRLTINSPNSDTFQKTSDAQFRCLNNFSGSSKCIVVSSKDPSLTYFTYVHDMIMRFWTVGYQNSINISLYDNNWNETCRIVKDINSSVNTQLKEIGYFCVMSYGGSCGYSGIKDVIDIKIHKLRNNK